MYPTDVLLWWLSLSGGRLLENHRGLWDDLGLNATQTQVIIILSSAIDFPKTASLFLRRWSLLNNGPIYYSQCDSPVIAFYLSERSRGFDLHKGWIKGVMSTEVTYPEGWKTDILCPDCSCDRWTALSHSGGGKQSSSHLTCTHCFRKQLSFIREGSWLWPGMSRCL